MGFQQLARRAALAVTMAGALTMLTQKNAVAGRFCSPEELLWVEEIAAIDCNEAAPPYYCGNVSDCWVWEDEPEPYMWYSTFCSFYSEDEPCPQSMSCPNGC